MESSFLPVQRPGLFRSRSWLAAWVKAWADHPQIDFPDKHSVVDINMAELRQLELESWVFSVNEPLLPFFSVLSAYPFGVSSRLAGSIRSEYFQFAIDPLSNALVDADYFDRALALKWDRLIFPDVLVGSRDYQAIAAAAELKKLSLMEGAYENTYGVNLKCSAFADYVKKLGKNTRLKLFNSRKKLEQHGAVSIENIWPDRVSFFKLLNDFHALRWGKPCYRERNQVFIHTLLDELAGTDAKVDFSVMSVNAVPVSVVFDICIHGRVYNLQAGYAEDFAKGIALGTLHLGYQLEAAFVDEQADYYDFMAGRGKKSDYKKSLSNSRAEFVTLTLVRNPLLHYGYKLKSCLRKIRLPLLEIGVLFSADFACSAFLS